MLVTLLGTNLGACGLAPLQRRRAPPQSPSNPLSSPLVVSSAFCSEALRCCVPCAFVRSFRSLNCCSLFSFPSLSFAYLTFFALPLLASPPYPSSTTSFVPSDNQATTRRPPNAAAVAAPARVSLRPAKGDNDTLAFLQPSQPVVPDAWSVMIRTREQLSTP